MKSPSPLMLGCEYVIAKVSMHAQRIASYAIRDTTSERVSMLSFATLACKSLRPVKALEIAVRLLLASADMLTETAVEMDVSSKSRATTLPSKADRL